MQLVRLVGVGRLADFVAPDGEGGPVRQIQPTELRQCADQAGLVPEFFLKPRKSDADGGRDSTLGANEPDSSRWVRHNEYCILSSARTGVTGGTCVFRDVE
jgi:hypothetical protein